MDANEARRQAKAREAAIDRAEAAAERKLEPLAMKLVRDGIAAEIRQGQFYVAFDWLDLKVALPVRHISIGHLRDMVASKIGPALVKDGYKFAQYAIGFRVSWR